MNVLWLADTQAGVGTLVYLMLKPRAGCPWGCPRARWASTVASLTLRHHRTRPGKGEGSHSSSGVSCPWPAWLPGVGQVLGAACVLRPVLQRHSAGHAQPLAAPLLSNTHTPLVFRLKVQRSHEDVHAITTKCVGKEVCRVAAVNLSRLGRALVPYHVPCAQCC
jgi:hypothetical protein